MRGVPSHPNKLSSTIEGDIEDIDGVMRITQIRVHYRIKHPKEKRAEVERALEHHERKCPAAMSVKGCIGVQWTADFEEE